MAGVAESASCVRLTQEGNILRIMHIVASRTLYSAVEESNVLPPHSEASGGYIKIFLRAIIVGEVSRFIIDGNRMFI